MKVLLGIIILVLVGISGFVLVAKLKYNTNVTFVARELIGQSGNPIAKNYPQGETIDNSGFVIPDGFKLAMFANLDEYGSPRVLAFDPLGTLFVSITKRGAVLAITDHDKDGIADRVKVVLSKLNNPHGIAFLDGKMLVAESNKVVLYNYDVRELVASPIKTILELPSGGRHFTRTIKVFNNKLYTSIGSSCDVCVEKNSYNGSIVESDLDGSNAQIFATGLRNTVFFDFDSEGRMWGSDMGRDFLGDNLPPDELNIIEKGGHYGWPFCYGDKILDLKFSSSYNCSDTKSAVVEYPAHSAPLGTTFIKSELFPNDSDNLLVAFHGSWNSTTPTGYKIIKVNTNKSGGGLGGAAPVVEDFITGWLTPEGNVLGRPVDMAFDEQGVLYISDDKANVIYLLTKENTNE